MIFWVQMGQWHSADEYEGQVREITFRSVCTSPMCPPDTAMTEYQHFLFSPDSKKLVTTHTPLSSLNQSLCIQITCIHQLIYVPLLGFQIFETVQQAHDVPFGSYFEVLVLIVCCSLSLLVKLS